MVTFCICVKIVPKGHDNTLDMVGKRGRGMTDDFKIFGLKKMEG